MKRGGFGLPFFCFWMSRTVLQPLGLDDLSAVQIQRHLLEDFVVRPRDGGRPITWDYHCPPLGVMELGRFR